MAENELFSPKVFRLPKVFDNYWGFDLFAFLASKSVAKNSTRGKKIQCLAKNKSTTKTRVAIDSFPITVRVVIALRYSIVDNLLRTFT